jgi:BolA family transcriptional regulator, general stress-responsive regulator
MNEARINQMHTLLEQAFQPSVIKINDDSQLHAGHAGAQSGKGHFSLEIKSKAFEGLRPIKQHQLIYGALGDMMQTEIHALAIKVLD